MRSRWPGMRERPETGYGRERVEMECDVRKIHDELESTKIGSAPCVPVGVKHASGDIAVYFIAGLQIKDKK